MIDDTLFKIWKVAEFDYQNKAEHQRQIDIYHSIEWYVNTGRTCLPWERSLDIANPKKLLRYVMRQDDQSVNGQIHSVTKYLRHYCQYY